MTGIPRCDVDFYSDEVVLDPYPFYARLRSTGPVVHLTHNDLYALPRYAEVSEVLRQPLRFVSSRGVSPIPRVNEILIGSTLNSDPPEHDRLRAITSEPLLPGALAEIEPRLREAADALVATLCARGEFDAIADFACYLPVTIVAELVGLPSNAGVDSMLRWASATFNLFGTENARTERAFEDLVDLRDFLLEYGRPEKLAPGGWARRIFEAGPERGLSPETCAQLMRDYINPSLDTTISVTGQIVKFLADDPEQWKRIRDDASLIPGAVEEAVRLATPIRAFTRYVIADSEIAGHRIPAGARVLVIYASANRDERKFPDPDRFDVGRDAHDHVGFGQGVHMCMGMHLARREIILLLEALRHRVERFELLGAPEVAMNNTIRAWATMPVRVHLGAPLPRSPSAYNPTMEPAPWLDVVVTRREAVADNIIALELARDDGAALPAVEAGAHIDVEARSGLIRQYSLTGDPTERARYRIGVLLDPDSRGGSAAVHARFEIGARVRIGRPRNHFAQQPAAAHTILFAGGIGITPLLSMAHALAAQGASWELHYCGGTAGRMAFLNELERFGRAVQVHVSEGPAEQRLDLDAVLADPAPGSHLYTCGPGGFMAAVVDAARTHSWSDACVHLERFGAELDTDGEPFTVVASHSRQRIEIRPGETIAERLAEHGIEVPVSCRSGVCGSCLTSVIEGTPDHRDLVQTDLEKAANERITVCCSRSRTRELVLDL